MANKSKKVISLEDIAEKAKGEIVEIPDWEPGKTINVRLRSIDVTPLLLEAGAFPDELSMDVQAMFDEGEDKKKEKSSAKPSQDIKVKMDKLMPIIDRIAEGALVEPTYEEIQKVYPLTNSQKMAIYNYVMRGIKKIKPFREE